MALIVSSKIPNIDKKASQAYAHTGMILCTLNNVGVHYTISTADSKSREKLPARKGYAVRRQISLCVKVIEFNP